MAKAKQPAETPQAAFRNRVVEVVEIEAGKLKPSPFNPRRHGDSQRGALRAILGEVGFAGALLARKVKGGKLELIDGHLRVEEAPPTEKLTVVVTDLSEDEARKLIAVYDPIGAMAETDADLFAKLIDGLSVEDAALRDLIAAVRDQAAPPVQDENPYTQKVESPIYEPTGPKPPVKDLYDQGKTSELTSQIEAADLPSDIRKFLLAAAQRHTVFRYDRIANFYAQSAPEVQKLFEASALVIIDFEQAIERGFVRLQEDVQASFNRDHPNPEAVR